MADSSDNKKPFLPPDDFDSEQATSPQVTSHESQITAPQAHQAGEVKAVELPGGIQLDLCWIPSGSFMMGSPDFENNRKSEETQHRVTISRGFWMGKYEVTQKQWKAIMGSNPSRFKGNNLPVENISWNDVQKFIQKLNQKTGKHFRLPTEAEWEYACRANTTTSLNNGKGLTTETGSCPNLDEVAWYDKNSDGKTHPVGQKKPNAWGIFDMHGNVWEMCQDWYYSDYYKKSPATDPTGPTIGGVRVFRGGSWDYDAKVCRSASRYWIDPSYRLSFLGVRLVLEEE